MDHEATREQLELAVAEPGGLDRLMAGDTPTAQAVAAHLAGCPDCTDELAHLERASSLIRTVVRERPPADLRERTLAAVRAAGVPRGPAAPAVAPVTTAATAPAVAPVTTPITHSTPASPGSSTAPAVETRAPTATLGRGRLALGWMAGIAAAVVLSVVATSIIVGSRVDERLAAESEMVEALQTVAIRTLQVTAEPDARRVALAGQTSAIEGDLVFSPRTSELVVVATGLTPPPAGQEYRCWVEQAGKRQRVGRMFFSDALAYWVGPAPAVAGLLGDATFGVSLVDANGSPVDTDPVLGGGL
jgi:hypothetical protein